MLFPKAVLAPLPRQRHSRSPIARVAHPLLIDTAHFMGNEFPFGHSIVGQELLELSRFTVQALNGELPSTFSSLLLCARLPFKKDEGVRPIAVGEVLCRLAAKVALNQVMPEVFKIKKSFLRCNSESVTPSRTLSIQHDALTLPAKSAGDETRLLTKRWTHVDF